MNTLTNKIFTNLEDFQNWVTNKSSKENKKGPKCCIIGTVIFTFYILLAIALLAGSQKINEARVDMYQEQEVQTSYIQQLENI